MHIFGNVFSLFRSLPTTQALEFLQTVGQVHVDTFGQSDEVRRQMTDKVAKYKETISMRKVEMNPPHPRYRIPPLCLSPWPSGMDIEGMLSSPTDIVNDIQGPQPPSNDGLSGKPLSSFKTIEEGLVAAGIDPRQLRRDLDTVEESTNPLDVFNPSMIMCILRGHSVISQLRSAGVPSEEEVKVAIRPRIQGSR